MDSQIKKAIAVSGAIFIALTAYYGSYLPMRKSMMFIETMKNSADVKTIKDFENLFSVPLDYPSPIGQEELVRSTANNVANGLQSVSDPKAVDELINYINAYYDPIISRGKGMSFGQNLYILGMMNEIAFIKTNSAGAPNPTYLKAAEKYFTMAHQLGPKRPQGLYGLLDVYRMEGNLDGFKKIADQVLSQWPDDEKVKNVVAQTLKNSPAQKTGK